MNRILFLGVATLLAQVAACGSSQSNPSSQKPGNPDNPDGGGDASGVADGNGDGDSSGNDGDVTPPTVTISRVDLDGSYYNLAVPAHHDAARSYPLVLILHGDGNSADTMRVDYPFDATSGEDAFVAYPSGHKDSGWYLWQYDRYGNAINLDKNNPYDNPDIAFLSKVIDDVKGKYHNIDKVFGAGWSSGAFMVNQVACVTDLFTAIASNAGGRPMINDQGGTPDFCNHVAAFVMHGADDNDIPVSSGVSGAQFWAQVNHCSDYNADIGPLPRDCNDLLWKDFPNCDEGYPVTLVIKPCTVHDPGSTVYAWNFFQQFL